MRAGAVSSESEAPLARSRCDGKARWPHRPEDRDLLYFLAQSFRARLAKDLPPQREAANGGQRELAHRAKALLRDLAALSLGGARPTLVHRPLPAARLARGL